MAKLKVFFSAIYLNEVYPKSFTEDEYFFVYLYLNKKRELHDPNSLDDSDLSLKLNGELPKKLKQLPPKNQFSDLVATTSDWNRYYLVAFSKSGKVLKLVLESDQFYSAELKYQKDQQ